MFQDWVFEVINGKDGQDYLLPFLTKSSIPLHAGSSSIIEFLNKLDEVKTQDGLDDMVDKNIQLINCSQWDPTKPITISNKAYLGTEILYDELVRKRIAQIRMIREGLQISGFWSFMVDHPNICREVFVSKDFVMTYDQFISLVTNDGKDETDFEKIQSSKFFDNFLVNASTETIQELFRFVTGFEYLPPWGISRSISVRYLLGDNERSFPEASCCFSILNLPTVHCFQKAFDEYFKKALDVEGVSWFQCRSIELVDIQIHSFFCFLFFLEKVYVVLLTCNMYYLTHFSLQGQCQVLQTLICLN